MAPTTHRWFSFWRRPTGQLPNPPVTLEMTPKMTPSVARAAMPASAQWDRVSAVVQLSWARVEAVNGCQALARQQLDVAAYTLQALRDELRTVMPESGLPLDRYSSGSS